MKKTVYINALGNWYAYLIKHMLYEVEIAGKLDVEAFVDFGQFGV
jgi:hypothetical protein